MINLETPRKLAPLAAQANEVAKPVFRPISRKYDRAEHEYPKELDMLAALMDGMEASGGDVTAPARPACGATATAPRGGQPQRIEHGDRARDHRALLRRRRAAALDAPPGPRQLRDRVGRERRAERALRRQCGPRWRSPSPPPARTPPRSARPPCSTATSTCSTARRSSSPSGVARRPDRRLGDARPEHGPRARSSRSWSPRDTPG